MLFLKVVLVVSKSQPAEKPMTRDAAQVLNRIAQLIAGDGAVEINYKGAVISGVDAKVASAASGRGRDMIGCGASNPPRNG